MNELNKVTIEKLRQTILLLIEVTELLLANVQDELQRQQDQEKESKQ